MRRRDQAPVALHAMRAHVHQRVVDHLAPTESARSGDQTMTAFLIVLCGLVLIAATVWLLIGWILNR